MPTYDPPVLDKRIRIRNPADKPDTDEDRYGREEQPPQWGTEAWANRRDRHVDTSFEQGGTVREGVTVWTIREIPGIAPDAEIIDNKGISYELIGPPIERGGVNGGLLTRYLELHSTRRTGATT